jgi:DNA-binding response OmpR family regulator
MIVDDDRTMTGLLKTLLQLDGFEVVLAGEGATAFGKASEARPDAFLVDYHLREMAGTEFVQQLRHSEQFAKTPIIMTSGLNREEEALEAGANRFLIKPFEPDDLVKLLNQLLGQTK